MAVHQHKANQTDRVVKEIVGIEKKDGAEE